MRIHNLMWLYYIFHVPTVRLAEQKLTTRIHVNFLPILTPWTQGNKVLTKVGYHIYAIKIQCDNPQTQNVIEKYFLGCLRFLVKHTSCPLYFVLLVSSEFQTISHLFKNKSIDFIWKETKWNFKSRCTSYFYYKYIMKQLDDDDWNERLSFFF